MFSYDVTEDATQITVTGEHSDPADTPEVYAFVMVHPLGTDRATIVADLEEHLRDEGRTGFGLSDYKTEKMALCDLECQRRFTVVGVEYPAASGKFFSLSIPAQLNFNGLRHGLSRLDFSGGGYRISTVDNQDSHQLADVADCDALYDTAFDAKAALIAGVNAVKHSVREAVDVAAVDSAIAAYLAVS